MKLETEVMPHVLKTEAAGAKSLLADVLIVFSFLQPYTLSHAWGNNYLGKSPDQCLGAWSYLVGRHSSRGQAVVTAVGHLPCTLCIPQYWTLDMSYVLWLVAKVSCAIPLGRTQELTNSNVSAE